MKKSIRAAMDRIAAVERIRERRSVVQSDREIMRACAACSVDYSVPRCPECSERIALARRIINEQMD